MACSCRLAQVRTFITGLAQVHKLEISSSSQFLSLPARSSSYPQRLITAKHTRTFQTSRYLSEDAIGSAPESVEESLLGSKETSSTRSEYFNFPAERSRSTPQEANNFEGDLYNTPTQHDQKWKEDYFQKDPPRRERQQKYSTATESRGSKEGHFKDSFEADTDRIPWRKSENASETRSSGSKPWTLRDKSTNPASTRWDGTQPPPEKKLEDWRMQKERLKEKFPEGWRPRKRLSPDALAGIRALNAQFPDIYTTWNLAAKFEVSPEAIRRILKSKWTPDVEEEQDRQERWHKRGMQIWETKAALGVKPPRKWRAEGITRDPEYHVRRQARIQRDKEWEENEIRKYRNYRENLQKAAGQVL